MKQARCWIRINGEFLLIHPSSFELITVCERLNPFLMIFSSEANNKEVKASVHYNPHNYLYSCQKTKENIKGKKVMRCTWRKTRKRCVFIPGSPPPPTKSEADKRWNERFVVCLPLILFSFLCGKENGSKKSHKIFRIKEEMKENIECCSLEKVEFSHFHYLPFVITSQRTIRLY